MRFALLLILAFPAFSQTTFCWLTTTPGAVQKFQFQCGIPPDALRGPQGVKGDKGDPGAQGPAGSPGTGSGGIVKPCTAFTQGTPVATDDLGNCWRFTVITDSAGHVAALTPPPAGGSPIIKVNNLSASLGDCKITPSNSGNIYAYVSTAGQLQIAPDPGPVTLDGPCIEKDLAPDHTIADLGQMVWFGVSHDFNVLTGLPVNYIPQSVTVGPRGLLWATP